MITTKDQNKILIVSESNNVVVKCINHWLVDRNIEMINLRTESDQFSVTRLDVNNLNFSFKINQNEYCFNDFKKIYFHRGALQLKDFTGVKSFLDDIVDFKTAFNYYRMAYEISLRESVSFLMHQEKTIGADNGGRINKLQMLNHASNAGLNIPKTLTTTCKNDVIDFVKIHKKIISKSMDLNFIFFDNDRLKLVHGLTCEILHEDTLDLPDEFPLTIFQENIEKVLELRIFFLGNTNYASAIFSQTSNHTIQDYRNYDDDFPNRIVPFILPNDIEHKINKFKEITGLKMGSIDIILSPMNDYYFLEVNPQGQFMGVSEFCNFYLEKEVANFIVA